MPFCYLKGPNPRDEGSSSSTPWPRTAATRFHPAVFKFNIVSFMKAASTCLTFQIKLKRGLIPNCLTKLALTTTAYSKETQN